MATPPVEMQSPPPQQAAGTSGLAVAGLVLAFVFAPVGLVLSLIALGQTGPGKRGGRGLAIAGSIISALSMALGIALIAAIAGGTSDAIDEVDSSLQELEQEVAEAAEAPPEPEPAAAEAEAEAEAEVEVEVEAAEPVEPEAEASDLIAIGSPATDGEFTFTVTRVERVGTTIGEDFLEETAQGEFVIVYVDVTNTGTEARTLSSSDQVLYDDQDRQFEASSAIFALPDADKAFLENINPGNTVTDAPLLFDVPPGAVLDRIELHDVFFSPGVLVSLR